MTLRSRKEEEKGMASANGSTLHIDSNPASDNVANKKVLSRDDPKCESSFLGV